MTDDRTGKLETRLWSRSAEVHRAELSRALPDAPQCLRFVDYQTTMTFGKAFWTEAARHQETWNVQPAPAIKYLMKRYSDETVLWLHRHANETGAISVRMDWLGRYIESLLPQMGPDVLFASEDLSFGCCWEKEEDRSILRAWEAERELCVYDKATIQ